VVDNARLYAEAQTRSAENRRLYEQSQASLREIERLNQQLIGGAWAEYLRGMPAAPAYTLDPTTGRIEDNADWTTTLAEASRRNQAVIRQVGEARVLALPISVRGQVIGAMEFEISPDQEIVPEQMSVLQQIVERLGLAVENARLLEEAQRIAQREALVSEISMRLQAATGVESVVAAATQSLADAFQSPHVAIRLSAPAGEAN
jgi:GAF domain-containing protein